MSADGALLHDVIAALEAADGIQVVVVRKGVFEISCEGQPLRTFLLRSNVSRCLLVEFERYYGVRMAAFYPPTESGVMKRQAG